MDQKNEPQNAPSTSSSSPGSKLHNYNDKITKLKKIVDVQKREIIQITEHTENLCEWLNSKFRDFPERLLVVGNDALKRELLRTIEHTEELCKWLNSKFRDFPKSLLVVGNDDDDEACFPSASLTSSVDVDEMESVTPVPKKRNYIQAFESSKVIPQIPPPKPSEAATSMIDEMEPVTPVPKKQNYIQAFESSKVFPQISPSLPSEIRTSAVGVDEMEPASPVPKKQNYIQAFDSSKIFPQISPSIPSGIATSTVDVDQMEPVTAVPEKRNYIQAFENSKVFPQISPSIPSGIATSTVDVDQMEPVTAVPEKRNYIQAFENSKVFPQISPSIPSEIATSTVDVDQMEPVTPVPKKQNYIQAFESSKVFPQISPAIPSEIATSTVTFNGDRTVATIEIPINPSPNSNSQILVPTTQLSNSTALTQNGNMIDGSFLTSPDLENHHDFGEILSNPLPNSNPVLDEITISDDDGEANMPPEAEDENSLLEQSGLEIFAEQEIIEAVNAEASDFLQEESSDSSSFNLQSGDSHQSETKTKHQSNVCPTSKKSFANNRKMRKQLDSVQLGSGSIITNNPEREPASGPYTCTICEREFPNKRSFGQHNRKHQK